MQIHFAARRGDIRALQRQLDRDINVDERDQQQKTPLMHAAEDNRAQLNTLQLLIDRGADVNASCSTFQDTPLLLAAHSGRIDKVRFLLAQGANPRYVSPQGYTVITTLPGSPDPAHLEILELLLRAGADPNVTSAYGETPLRNAIREGNFAAVRLLLEHGADRDSVQMTDLMWAIALGSVEQVAAEIRAGADLSARNDREMSPWLLSLQTGDFDKARLLWEQGAQLDDQDRSGHTPLMYAVMAQNAEMTAWLISLGASLNDTNFLDMTPLNLAAGMGAVDCAELLIAAGASLEPPHGDPVITNAASPAMVRTLVSHGADINAVDGEGYWLLRSAAEEGDYPFACELLDLGADPDATSTGATALHTAVLRDQLEIVTALLQHGADPNAYDVDSWTPLMYAGSLECVELLLAAGAEIGATDLCDDDVIQHHTDPEIIQRLQAAGASIETQPAALNSLLHTAASEGDLSLLNYLLEQHLNVNTPLQGGVTPLMTAAERGHTVVLERLLASGADLQACDEQGRTALFYAAAPEAFLAFQLGLEHSAEAAKNDLLNELEDLPAEAREIFDELDFSLNFGYQPSDDVTSLDLLLDAGADLEDRDSEGATPLLVACCCGRPARVERLIQRGADRRALDAGQRSAQELTALHHDRDQAAQILKLLQQSG